MKKIIKKLEKIAEKQGAEELTKVIESIYCNSVQTMGDPPLPPGKCPTGKVWNPILEKCVDDLG